MLIHRFFTIVITQCAIYGLPRADVVPSGSVPSCRSRQSTSEAGVVSFLQRTAALSANNISDMVSVALDSNISAQKEPYKLQQNVSSIAVVQGMQSYLPQGLTQPLRSEMESLMKPLRSHAVTLLSAHVAQDGNPTLEPLIDKDIWNPKDSWVNFTFWHPSGVISNVYGGRVVWANVNFINVVGLFELSMFAYPFAIIPLALSAAVVVGLSLQKEGHGVAQEDFKGPPAVPASELNALSQSIYAAWCAFCRAIPAMFVFGVPMALIYLSHALPQEVYVIMLITSSAFVFSNGVYMALFSPFFLWKLMQNNRKTPLDVLGDLKADQKHEVVHWVVFPNFKEEAEIIEAALRSIARSSLACSSICILLAMEEREGEPARRKSKAMAAIFDGRFREFLYTFHPMGLPNDPPGKASNVSYAHKELLKHLRSSGQDISKVILTVADADSEFHETYFETLTREYFENSEEERNVSIWQSAVLHAKNYHRQPAPVAVGTMFTAITEFAFLADPNGIRFPYSTYSLTLELATKVGGWDAEWIAEDWHMGLKCFLFTLGRSRVKPIALPLLNYSPESETWSDTCRARWVQAKRHALGISDLSYYFMMLPLIFLHLSSVKRADGANLGDFWRLFVTGLALVVRLVNTHVILGILTMYAVFDTILKQVMLNFLGEARGIGGLFDRTFFATTTFGVASVITLSIVTINFQVVYRVLQDRFEKPKSEWKWMFANVCIHWLMSVVSFLVWASVYFLALAYAVWLASLKMLFVQSFTYDVAAKPSEKQRM
mmetsp:Transcript_6006/g.9777  ORF Transcript_6006/g.9777 Transcript_6006/m.9777 type:complete len:775 (-) Transcript_6006:147-2471(-)